MKRKLIVITDAEGKVVGTQVHEDPTSPSGAFAHLVPGPGQKRHEIEIEMPPRFVSRKDIEQFHAHVENQLRPKP
jgi:hypothetical protein